MGREQGRFGARDEAVGCLSVERQLVERIIEDPADDDVNTHQGLPGTAAFFEGVGGQLA